MNKEKNVPGVLEEERYVHFPSHFYDDVFALRPAFALVEEKEVGNFELFQDAIDPSFLSSLVNCFRPCHRTYIYEGNDQQNECTQSTCNGIHCFSTSGVKFKGWTSL